MGGVAPVGLDMELETIKIILAWITALNIVLLSIIYPLRKYVAKRKFVKAHPLCRLNRFLRKIHIPLGVLTIPLTFLHCRLSSYKLGLNMGTICLVFLLLLLTTYVLRKPLKGKWMFLHRFFTGLLWIVLLMHIVLDTERIRIFILELFQ